jgi:GTP-binding protein
MVDARLGFTELDERLLDFVAPRLANGSVRLLVLLTKADKLGRGELHAASIAAQRVLGARATDESDLNLLPFSSLKRTGVDDAARLLRAWVDVAAPTTSPSQP